MKRILILLCLPLLFSTCKKEDNTPTNNTGNNIDITVYPGASHSFDRTMEVVLADDAYSFTDCRLKMTKEGVVRMLNGFPLSSPALQKIGLGFCADKGAHCGGNKLASENSSDFAKEFMRKHLLD